MERRDIGGKILCYFSIKFLLDDVCFNVRHIQITDIQTVMAFFVIKGEPGMIRR